MPPSVAAGALASIRYLKEHNEIRERHHERAQTLKNKLLKAVPDEFKHDAHHWLILHGRYVCQARKPKCAACIIHDLCEYKGKE